MASRSFEYTTNLLVNTCTLCTWFVAPWIKVTWSKTVMCKISPKVSNLERDMQKWTFWQGNRYHCVLYMFLFQRYFNTLCLLSNWKQNDTDAQLPSIFHEWHIENIFWKFIVGNNIIFKNLVKFNTHSTHSSFVNYDFGKVCS